MATTHDVVRRISGQEGPQATHGDLLERTRRIQFYAPIPEPQRPSLTTPPPPLAPRRDSVGPRMPPSAVSSLPERGTTTQTPPPAAATAAPAAAGRTGRTTLEVMRTTLRGGRQSAKELLETHTQSTAQASNERRPMSAPDASRWPELTSARILASHNGAQDQPGYRERDLRDLLTAEQNKLAKTVVQSVRARRELVTVQ